MTPTQVAAESATSSAGSLQLVLRLVSGSWHLVAMMHAHYCLEYSLLRA